MYEQSRVEQVQVLTTDYLEIAESAKTIPVSADDSFRALLKKAFVQDALLCLLQEVDPSGGRKGSTRVRYFDLLSEPIFVRDPGPAFKEDPHRIAEANLEAQRAGIRELVDLLGVSPSFLKAVGLTLERGDTAIIDSGVIEATSETCIPGVKIKLAFTDQRGLPELYYLVA